MNTKLVDTILSHLENAIIAHYCENENITLSIEKDYHSFTALELPGNINVDFDNYSSADLIFIYKGNDVLEEESIAVSAEISLTILYAKIEQARDRLRPPTRIIHSEKYNEEYYIY